MRVNLSIYIIAICIIISLYILNNTLVYEGFSEYRVFVFYHIYCNQNTLEVVKDQTTTIINSGLYNRANNIYCFLAGDEVHVMEIKKYIESLPDKFVVKAVGVGDNSYERFTLNKIADTIQETDKFLYIHTKGVATSDESKKNNILLWRKYMEYQLIDRYDECIAALDKYDVVGVAYATRLIGPHFSGNFWWSTGTYYINLQKSVKIGDGYWDPESYLFKNNPRYNIIDNTVPFNADLYNMSIYPSMYKKA